ncbi:AAA family ATPase [Pseudoramibacter alactolyticus]|uniref:cytidylate kinase-like family protein n=1 Tax=Pseudoramibacter alactolyticus TaxID=113287 RepID=UPI00248F2A1B|nr:cytidylate kinase-like family protein [Pseudoramibacter alactolyticus]
MGKVLTIGREYGSDGRAIAREAAQALGVAFCDKERIRQITKMAKLPEMVRQYDADHLEYEVDDYHIGRGYFTVETDDAFTYHLESAVMAQVAAAEDAVIVGRCGDYVLRDKADSRHIFIYAPFDYRVKLVSRRDAVSPEDAARVVKQMDLRRSQYYTYYTDRSWNDLRHYHLSFDAAAFSRDNSIRILIQAFAAI